MFPVPARVTVVVAALTAVLCVATASAQLDEQLDVGEQTADTDYTPVAKNGGIWNLAAGARYGSAEVIEGSPTEFDVDLFDVSFRSNKRGFAGGAECKDEPALPEGTETCPRVPVMYSFTQHKNGEKIWSKEDLGGESAEPGFVGAIAWLDNNRAVAVGGTGCYPRREEPCPDGRVSGGADPIAGAGRAWYFDGTRWRELTVGAGELPAGVGGMTALDFRVGANGAFGAAGGLGQLIEWRKDRFDRVLDSNSPESELYNHRFLRHRVREIRFAADGAAHAFGVTAGWSEGDELSSPPVVVQYLGSSWSVSKFGYDATDPTDPERTRGKVNSTGWEVWEEPNPPLGKRVCVELAPWAASCLPVSCTFLTCEPEVPSQQGSLEQHAIQLGEETGDEVYEAGARDLDERQGVPDSFYSLTRVGNCFSALMSDGGTEADGEPASMLTQRWSASNQATFSALSEPVVVATRPRLTTARLVAGDGDNAAAKTQSETLTTQDVFGCGGSGTGDGFPDWSVGELRSSGPRGERQGLFMSTHLRPVLQGGTIRTTPPATDELNAYRPTTEEKLRQHLQSGYTRAPSYSLNAIDVLDEFGTGWAVGDHGAILSLSSEDVNKSLPEPDPPALGERATQRLSDRSPWNAFADLTAPPEPGVVPPLMTQPLETADEPALAPEGFIGGVGGGPIATIVMSRSGDEGWAFRRGNNSPDSGGVVHFDGLRWTACYMPGAAEVDRACEGAPRFRSNILTAARVPMENDDEPANDDDLVVVAVSDRKVYRYQGGRWAPEDAQALAGIRTKLDFPYGMAFTAPDDGLILDRRIPGGRQQLYHFNGEVWTDCTITCDPHDRLGVNQNLAEAVGLVAAGDRIYLYGARSIATELTSLSASADSLPLIAYRARDEQSFAGAVREGEYDPGFDQTAATVISPGQSGYVDGLALVERGDGRYDGLATGVFGNLIRTARGGGRSPAPATSSLLRLDATGRWAPADAGAAADFSSAMGDHGATTAAQLAVTGGEDGIESAFMAQSSASITAPTRLFAMDPATGRFDVLQTGLPAFSSAASTSAPAANIPAIAPDGRGGFWGIGNGFVFHHTEVRPRPVFREVPAPEREPGRRIEGLAAAPDGSVWARTNSDTLYRYDRLTGWEKARIPGWDPGPVVTVTSAVNAIAVGPGGEGLAVGKEGRIARFSPGVVELDRAAGTVCDLAAIAAPCGTSRDLRAVAIADDGSAIAAGDRLSLLWRPPGGDFRAITRPDAALNTSCATRKSGPV